MEPRLWLTAILIAGLTLALGAAQWIALRVRPEVRIRRYGITRISATGAEHWDRKDIRDFRIEAHRLADKDVRLLTFRTAEGEFALELPPEISDQDVKSALRAGQALPPN